MSSPRSSAPASSASGSAPSGPALVALRQVEADFGGRPVFSGIDLAVHRGDRACLVGRNGSGKSTLLRMLAGVMEPDAGERFVQPGARVIYLPQDPTLPADRTVGEHLAEALPDEIGQAAGVEDYRIPMILEPLGITADQRLGELSGGGRRRAAIGRALIAEPEILLLDEPTNHLDLPTIEWLEAELSRFQGGMMMISHDRAFLNHLTRRTCWLDRGRMHETARGFAEFDVWAEELRLAEEAEYNRMENRIAEEERYMQRGVTARRKRNMRRVALLAELRQQKKTWIGEQGSVKTTVAESDSGGKMVIEAENISKTYGERKIVTDFSTRIMRGDRLGLIGPNGAGKTTLLRMLTGELAPDSGDVRLGTGLQVAYFDQNRATLDENETPWGYLCDGGGDQVMVNGAPRHVVSYIRDFLFEERQATAKISTLSGGERNRLVLAKLFAKPSNLLVLDEPTNDLDMDTLDLLLEVLSDYQGSLLLVSHDRDFLDKLVTSVIAVEGGGVVEEYPGGHSDYLHLRALAKGEEQAEKAAAKAEKKAANAAAQPAQKQKANKLTYKDQRELDLLPGQITKLQAKIDKLQEELADPDLYSKKPDRFQKASEALTKAQDELDEAETRWLELEEMKESLG